MEYKENEENDKKGNSFLNTTEKYLIPSQTSLTIFEEMAQEMNFAKIEKEIEKRTDDSLELLNFLFKITSKNGYVPPEGFITQKLINWITFGFESSNEEEFVVSIKACANMFYYINYPEEFVNDQIYSLIFSDESMKDDNIAYLILTLINNIISPETVNILIDNAIMYKLIEKFDSCYAGNRDSNILCSIFNCAYRLFTAASEEKRVELIDIVNPLLVVMGGAKLTPKERSCNIIWHLIHNNTFLRAFVSNSLFENITCAAEIGYSLYPTLFKIFTFLLSNGYEIERDHIYTGLNNAIITRTSSIAAATNEIVEFLYIDMDVSKPAFKEKLLDQIKENIKEGSSKLKIGAARLLLKYISLSPLSEGKELAAEYFPFLFDSIPFIERNNLLSSIKDLYKILRKDNEYITIAFQSDIDDTLFEDLDKDDFDDDNISTLIDELYDFLHPG